MQQVFRSCSWKTTADIVEIDFVSTHLINQMQTLSVKVFFNENVTVSGTPQLTVVNDQSTNHTLSYASGSTTNELVFELAIYS